ncbi:uncharacterized protein TNCV_3568391 [Trichonephila clavipes]|nr:uncharacterized protein TNCV_3568391 [Trichonephila clavipes]
MGPPMRRREGEKWTAPDVLKGWKNREKGGKKKRTRKRRKTSLEKTRAGRFRKRRGESQSFFGLGSNPGEGMAVCECIVPPRHGGSLKSRQAASPLVRLVEGEERWKAPDHPQGVLPQNWGGNEQNRTCMVLKTTDNDRRTI